jgi:hypothetical protein
MKKSLFALFVGAAVTFALAPESFGSAQERERQRTRTNARTITTDSSDRDDLQEKDEFQQSYNLSAGAKVEVRGINGAVDIDTGPGSTAEVHIVRSARNREVEYARFSSSRPRRVLSFARKMSERGFGRNRDVRQRVCPSVAAVDLGVSG